MSDILAPETTVKNHLHLISGLLFVSGGDITPQHMNRWYYFSDGANEGQQTLDVTGFENYLQLK